MKVVVDQDRCVGNGVCESIAGDLFVVDDDAIARPRHDEIPADRYESALEAVESCPSQALRISE
ncbi:ferredoxin [Mycobacterium intermedium]|uniref:Ferredoxin n=1 Tax=Mycobacterium intermedium TaxID=28445 RepID=A0A1E3SL55_MYCIE|nr:ferredoxin [Mycobacterium intermedium]MCV6963466.1 ferredoxin [Mycobacterium intermedium]ODR02851.1 ferredoxin [Mycobacterium intermedium]OPE49921.1 ferredoxin [Mycobacterium intermedium]ORB02772.1 ferredoxin [Mycobacterium intermedium]